MPTCLGLIIGDSTLPIRVHSRLFAVCPAQDFTSRASPNQTVEPMPWSAVRSRLDSIIVGAVPGIAHLWPPGTLNREWTPMDANDPVAGLIGAYGLGVADLSWGLIIGKST